MLHFVFACRSTVPRTVMLIRIFFFCSCVALSRAQWQLYWSDEFDGTSIDGAKWEHECTAWGGGNGEFEVYTPSGDTSFVENGKLHIYPRRLGDITNPKTGQPYGADFIYNGVLDLNYLYGYCTQSSDSGCYRIGYGQGVWTDIPPIASARLRTYQRFAFRYGRVEVYAKVPKGDWMWPAIWMLPENWCYGGWPTSGEMDITESVSNEDFRFPDGTAAGVQKMGSTMHWGVDPGQNRFYLTSAAKVDEGNDYANFHLYALEWTPEGMSYFVDGSLVLQVPSPSVSQNPDWNGFYAYGAPWNGANPWDPSNNADLAPFDAQFHLILNVAVGGTGGFIPDNAINRGGAYPKPWNNGVSQKEGMNRFIEAEDQWYWTWEKEGLNAAMQVEYVRVYKRSDLPPEQGTDCP